MGITETISLAFAMGLVGSLHCIGMCGPIALSLPLGNQKTSERLIGGSLYNLGRVFTYAWLGLVLGMAGGFLITPKLQSFVSVFFGVTILLYLLLPAGVKRSVSNNAATQGFFIALRKQLGSLLSSRTKSSFFGIGMLNGLLPCGTVYLALTSSFLTGNVLKGALFMAFFGAGTFPAMFGLTFFGGALSQNIRFNLRKIVPFFLFCMAALLVLRGLNLGIPYISPSLPDDAISTTNLCH